MSERLRLPRSLQAVAPGILGANMSMGLPALRGFRAYALSAIDRITFGELAEARAAQALERAGYEVLPSKLPRGQGMDVVGVKRGVGGDVENMIVAESKASARGRAYLSWTKGKGQQLSTRWMQATIDQMRASADPAVRQTGNLLFENRGLIRIKANVLDPYGVNRWNRIKLPPR